MLLHRKFIEQTKNIYINIIYVKVYENFKSNVFIDQLNNKKENI